MSKTLPAVFREELMRSFLQKFFCTLLFFSLTAPVQASSYLEMDLEALMEVTVTSLSKRKERLFDSAAALCVLTSGDIRRSGATRIEEALRMVPGLMVAQNSSWIWSISSRGRSCNPTYENKLLVLIDGQSVYSPLFSGTLWETINLNMEHIDRIEVIRGPGGSTWGSNAVNGIINIITKSAEKTTGTVAKVRIGEKGNNAVAFSFGDDIFSGDYRLYGNFRKQQEAFVEDELKTRTIGFRLDSAPDLDSSLYVSGDIFSGTNEGTVWYPDLKAKEHLPFFIDEKLNKLRFNSGYSSHFSADNSLSIQTGYIRDKRQSDFISLETDQAELEVLFQAVPLRDHLVQFGFEYHLMKLAASKPFEQGVKILKGCNADHLVSGFFWDTVEFDGGRWILSLGSKMEYLEDIGFELSPSARLLFKADENNVFWGAASRTIRTPSYTERFVRMPVTVEQPFEYLIRYSLVGNPKLREEDARSLEIGYRLLLPAGFMFDASVFYTRYQGLSDAAQVEEPVWVNDILEVDMLFDNLGRGTVRGGELALTWDVVSWLRLHAWYSYCKGTYRQLSTRTFFASQYGHINPDHQYFLRSSFTLPLDIELDLLARHVSKLRGVGMPAYTELDARLGFRPGKNIELSLVGKNLLKAEHTEAANYLFYGAPAMLERSVAFEIRMDF